MNKIHIIKLKKQVVWWINRDVFVMRRVIIYKLHVIYGINFYEWVRKE